MSKTPLEIQIRERVLALQSFYKSLTLYCLVNFLFVLLWVIFNHDYFWPIWSIMIWGGLLAYRGFALGLVPLFEDMFPFFQYQWVEEEVERRVAKSKKQTTAAPAAKPAAKKTTAKKAPAKKAPTKKPVSKKPAKKVSTKK